MIYVFDTSPLIDLFKHYYQERFPTLWKHFYQMIDSQRIISTRETLHEIENHTDLLSQWVKDYKKIFEPPSAKEAAFITEIFQIPHFQNIIEKRKILQGGYNADPFVIAKAKIKNASVVTNEVEKPNAPNIPAICAHFRIPYINLEEFMETENWIF